MKRKERKLSAQQLTILAFSLLLGLCAKKLVSPATNVITDFFRIPGGSAATGFSLAFIVLGCSCVPGFGVGMLMGSTQGLLALILGMSGYQGILCVLTYTIPGLMIDVVGKLYRKKDEIYFVTACGLSNLVCAVFSNFLIFHLKGMAYVLWLLMGGCSGITGGMIAHMIYGRLVRALKWEGCVER